MKLIVCFPLFINLPPVQTGANTLSMPLLHSVNDQPEIQRRKKLLVVYYVGTLFPRQCALSQ